MEFFRKNFLWQWVQAKGLNKNSTWIYARQRQAFEIKVFKRPSENLWIPPIRFVDTYRFPSWRRMWSSRLPLVLKDWPQWSYVHTKGRSSVCTRACNLRLCASPKLLLQPGKVHLNGCKPVCRYSWATSRSLRANCFPQPGCVHLWTYLALAIRPGLFLVFWLESCFSSSRVGRLVRTMI